MIEFDLTEHDCEAFILCCMDFRQMCKQTLHGFMIEQGYKTYDLVALPGSCKALMNEDSRKIVVDAIKICRNLHNCKEIFLIHHRDCGAYGGSKPFESPNAELEHHKNELRKAKSILKDELKIDLPVNCVFLDSECDVTGNGYLKVYPID